MERALLEVSEVQQRIADFVTGHGRTNSRAIAEGLSLQPRAVRYHLGILADRGVIAARGGRKGRYYTPSTDPERPAPAAPLAATNAIIAEVFRRGGRITRSDLIALVRQHDYDPRTVGILHGRRMAHLRREPGTDISVLTARGEEVARQYLFAARMAERAREGGQ